MKTPFKLIAIFVFLTIIFAVGGFIFNYIVKVPVLKYTLYALAGVNLIAAVITVIAGYISVNKKK